MYLRIDRLNCGEPTQIDVDGIRELTDSQLAECMRGDTEILRLRMDGAFERLEFVNGLVPNWVEVPTE